MAKDGSENAWIQELNTLSSSIEHEVLAMALVTSHYLDYDFNRAP